MKIEFRPFFTFLRFNTPFFKVSLIKNSIFRSYNVIEKVKLLAISRKHFQVTCSLLPWHHKIVRLKTYIILCINQIAGLTIFIAKMECVLPIVLYAMEFQTAEMVQMKKIVVIILSLKLNYLIQSIILYLAILL